LSATAAATGIRFPLSRSGREASRKAERPLARAFVLAIRRSAGWIDRGWTAREAAAASCLSDQTGWT